MEFKFRTSWGINSRKYIKKCIIIINIIIIISSSSSSLVRIIEELLEWKK
jgi:hypothetical protein